MAAYLHPKYDVWVDPDETIWDALWGTVTEVVPWLPGHTPYSRTYHIGKLKSETVYRWWRGLINAIIVVLAIILAYMTWGQ